ncbi:MAG TPA: hypothetical protein VIY53_05680 [Acidobacteriaceae bacterium]
MKTPQKEIQYLSSPELAALYADQDFDRIIEACTERVIVEEEFAPNQLMHPGTIKERGAVYTDATGIRAVIFYYKQSDGHTVRSIKRLVTSAGDFRLPQPTATPDRQSPTASIRNQQNFHAGDSLEP